MAFVTRRRDGRFEIREAHRGARGPRARSLASFRGALSPEILDAAEARASRPFDRARLVAAAEAIGLPVVSWRECRPARELIAWLRGGHRLDPTLASLLRGLLEATTARDAGSAPAPLAEVCEWLGAAEAERGHALRGLLRVSDRILQSRGPLRRPEERRFPRFESRPRRAA